MLDFDTLFMEFCITGDEINRTIMKAAEKAVRVYQEEIDCYMCFEGDIVIGGLLNDPYLKKEIDAKRFDLIEMVDKAVNDPFNFGHKVENETVEGIRKTLLACLDIVNNRLE